MRTIPELPADIREAMKQIGSRLTELRQGVEPNYKKLSDTHNINNMTLWRIQKGEDYKMSSLLQVLKAIGCTPEDFFKGIK
jgi:predicted transcriptional regulator